MPIVRSFGTLDRQNSSLASLALTVATDEAFRRARCEVKIVASGNSDDYNDWIVVLFTAPTAILEVRCAEIFAMKMSRHGVTQITRL
jgi:hypothetical protein